MQDRACENNMEKNMKKMQKEIDTTLLKIQYTSPFEKTAFLYFAAMA